MLWEMADCRGSLDEEPSYEISPVGRTAREVGMGVRIGFMLYDADSQTVQVQISDRLIK